MRLVGVFTVLVFILSLPLGAVDGAKGTIDLSGFFLTRRAGSVQRILRNPVRGNGSLSAYSYLREATGSATAALKDWTLIVRRARIRAARAARMNIQGPIVIR